MINNRQNGRRRGRNGNGQRQGNPGNPGGGSRIDNRARGNANQLYEKYKNLARDAQMSGDRVNTEYYLQFADHYFRVLSESRGRFEEQGQRRISPVDSFDDLDGDDDYGDEGEPIRAGEQGVPNGGDRSRGDYQGNGGQRDYQRDGGQRGDYQRDAGQRDGGQRDGGQSGNGRRDGGQGDNGRGDNGRAENGRGDGRYRDAGQRDAGQRDGGQRDEPRRNDFRADRAPVIEDRDDRFAVTGSPVANDPGEDSPDGAEPTPVARRRGRPRRDAAPVVANDAPAAIEPDRLPPSLALASPPVDDDGEPPRPRRRRVRAADGETSQAG